MKGKTLTHKTLSGLTWSFIGLGAQGLSQITILCILARFLSPEDFGLVGAALIVINFANIFHELSVGPAIVQRSVLEKRHIEAGFAVSVLVSLSLFGVVFLTIPAIEIFFKMPQLSPILKTMIIIIPINGMAVVSQSLLQRELKFRTIAVIEVASYIIGFGLVGIILAALEKGVWALVFAYLAQSFCKTVFLLAINRHAKRLALDFKALGDLMRLGFGFTLGGVASYWASQGDNLVAGKILGPKALGIYGRAYQLMVMPAALFGEVIDRALFPAMAKIQDDKEKLIKAYLYSLASVAILVLPFSVVIFIVAPEFVAVLLGEKWTAVVLPFQILCVGMFFRASYKMSESLVRALGAVYRRAWRQFVYTFFVLTGAIVGSRWGVSGIAGGTLLAVTITFMLMAHLSLKLLRLSPVDFIKVHFPALRLTFLCGAAGLIIKQMCSAILLSAAVTLIIMLILILTIIYMAIRIKPYFFFGKEGLWLFNTLIERIPDHLNRRIRNILNFSTNISDEYT